MAFKDGSLDLGSKSRKYNISENWINSVIQLYQLNQEEEVNHIKNLISYIRTAFPLNITLDKSNKYFCIFEKSGEGPVFPAGVFSTSLKKKDGSYIITLGFDVGAGLTAKIAAYQGVKGAGVGDLSEVLLEESIDFFKSKGFRKIFMPQADHIRNYYNPYGIISERAIEDHKRKMHQRYDILPEEKFGFNYIPELYGRVLVLN